jgi:ABC-2 type transport system ATP-binding protein
MPAISVQGLTKKFNGLVAVDNVSFSIEKGVIFGFLGPNGAGKTTTINVLCTLLGPDLGRAEVNGYDCRRQPDEVRRSIGIVFQDTTLDKDLTAYENLKYHAYLYRVPKDEIGIRVDDALRFIGLFDRKRDLVRTFSGGMKRRLEVARALVHQPEILFLDEPTLGLDPQSRSSLWSFIKELPHRMGVTVFMTTHYMEEAEVCDDICIIDNGRIIARGTPAELKSRLGGDMLYLKTSDTSRALKDIKDIMGIEAEEKGDEIFFSTLRGDVCIPEIIRILGENVKSVRLQRPTLNDVFLRMTGREIRDTEMDSTDNLKEDIRAYRRKFDR